MDSLQANQTCSEIKPEELMLDENEKQKQKQKEDCSTENTIMKEIKDEDIVSEKGNAEIKKEEVEIQESCDKRELSQEIVTTTLTQALNRTEDKSNNIEKDQLEVEKQESFDKLELTQETVSNTASETLDEI
jgi:hypothetical protein